MTASSRSTTWSRARSETSSTSSGERLHVRASRRVHVPVGPRACRRRPPPREPGLADRLLEDPHPDPEGRKPRHAQHAGTGASQGREVPPRLDERGVRRPPRAPPVRGLLGQRQPDRTAWRVRRGQALRRGHDDGLPPHARSRRPHRAHVQHLRAAHATRRRSCRHQLHRAGASRRSPHALWRRLADAQLLLRRRPDRRAARAVRVELRGAR